MSANLRPLEDAAVERLKTWLPKLSHPVRIGEHDQTAFGLGLMLDYARSTKNDSFARLVEDSARKFFLADRDCPLNYEPSGEDFLSPCLGEADVMRRVLPQTEFAKWLSDFMPQIPMNGNGDWLKPVVSPDPSDPKLAHLDGLNLSRAWMLEGILSALPQDDRRYRLRQTRIVARALPQSPERITKADIGSVVLQFILRHSAAFKKKGRPCRSSRRACRKTPRLNRPRQSGQVRDELFLLLGPTNASARILAGRIDFREKCCVPPS